MKHDLRRPCAECPFRNDLRHGYLRAERITEICESLYRGGSFPCHKTTTHDEEGDWEQTGDEQQCAGASIFLAKQGTSTQLERIAERLGRKVAPLDMDAPVCGSHREMLEAHGHEQESEYEPCNVCDSDCLHPAGYAVGGGVVECTDGGETRECMECYPFVCENCSRQTEHGWLCNDCQEADEPELCGAGSEGGQQG